MRTQRRIRRARKDKHFSSQATRRHSSCINVFFYFFTTPGPTALLPGSWWSRGWEGFPFTQRTFSGAGLLTCAAVSPFFSKCIADRWDNLLLRRIGRPTLFFHAKTQFKNNEAAKQSQKNFKGSMFLNSGFRTLNFGTLNINTPLLHLLRVYRQSRCVFFRQQE